jgi:hypothetical protein
MGNWFGGFYGAIIIERDLLEGALSVVNDLNGLFGIPILVITTGKTKYKDYSIVLDRSYKKKLRDLTETIRSKGKVGILVIPEGAMK